MKKWVVEIEKENGRRETRLVPARNKCTAISNCKHENEEIISCVPYTGQNVKVSRQRDEEEYGYGGYTFGHGFGYGTGKERKHGRDNVIGLSEANHRRIHKEYDRGYMAKKKMQRTLYDMLQRFRREFGDSGGI